MITLQLKERTDVTEEDFLRPDVQSSWPENAIEILSMRYLRKDSAGSIVESPDDRMWAVAKDIAAAELQWKPFVEAEAIAQAFFKLLMSRKFLPNSPTIMNAGKNNGLQYSACYVIPVEDSIQGIFEAVKHAAVIHQSGGGTGMAFSRLRPKEDVVRTTSGVASGPVSFMKVFDAATEQLKQGGTRRGANMGILRIDHPDVLEFVDCKLTGGLSNFNISCAITDEFMRANEEDETYALINPRTKEEVGRLKARDVFNKIVHAGWQTGDPGLVFIDRINASPANPVPACGPVESTNPCGEQPLYAYESCNLGSLNLGLFVKNGSIDYDQLGAAIKLAVRFLDDVIERNPYPLPEISKIVRNNRRIGLGVMGWADLLFQLALAYDSDEAIILADEVLSFIRRTAHQASHELAEERGVFPNWEGSIYRQKYALRNSTVTTIAPTGTISIIAGCSSGIEPTFGLYYKHRLGFEFFNPYLEKTLKKRGLWNEGLKDQIRESGSIAETDLSEDIKRVFKTAHEISPDWHVRVQAVFQKHTDNAVSKTINLPHEARVEDVRKAYLLAWNQGCMGITVYRDGCKPTQVLTRGKKHDEEDEVTQKAEMRRRPQILHGQTIQIESPHGTVYTTINEDTQGLPLELFITIGKAGSDVTADAEGLGRALSLLLRMPSPIETLRRLELIRKHLNGIGGSRDIGFGSARVRSIPDAISRAISKYFEEREGSGRQVPSNETVFYKEKADSGNLCPECGQSTVRQEGCEKCFSCSWSGC